MKTTKSVNEKNTKTEILEAYQELLQKTDGASVTDSVITQATKTEKAVSSSLRQQAEQVKTFLDETIQTLEEQMNAITSQLSAIKQHTEEQKKTLEQEKQQILMTRARDEEEYFYQYAKTKKRQEEELKEQKTKFESEITEKKEELKAQETELADLRNQAKTFEPRLAKGIADAVEKAMKELKLQFDHEKTLTTQQAKSTQSLLEQKIELLEHALESQKSEIERLNKVATDAASQMTRIAERAVTKTPEPQAQSLQSTSR